MSELFPQFVISFSFFLFSLLQSDQLSGRNAEASLSLPEIFIAGNRPSEIKFRGQIHCETREDRRKHPRPPFSDQCRIETLSEA